MENYQLVSPASFFQAWCKLPKEEEEQIKRSGWCVCVSVCLCICVLFWDSEERTNFFFILSLQLFFF